MTDTHERNLGVPNINYIGAGGIQFCIVNKVQIISEDVLRLAMDQQERGSFSL